MNDEIVIIKQLDELKEEHRQLDARIQLMQEDASQTDELQIARMKKRKLQLRDQIMTLEVEIYPDMPA
ncbi:MAG: YdcH family protein [Rickettsiales bacterium]